MLPFANVSRVLPIDLASYVSSFAPRNFPKDIVVGTPPYFALLPDILAGEDAHVLQAYFVVRAAFRYGKLLGPGVEVRKEVERFGNVLQGIKPGAEVDREEG